MNLERAAALARQLMDEWTLRDWKFKFDNAKNRFGLCSYRNRTISLSTSLVFLNTEERVRDVVLHEIAHAMCPAGVHHGPLWRQVASMIGCTSDRCYPHDVVRPATRWTLTCPSCGKKSYRSKRTRSFSCGACSPGKWNPAFELVWSTTDTDSVLELYKTALANS